VKKKDINYYMSLPYTITLKRGTQEGKKYWVARVLELPHCMTHAATYEEAICDIEDAKKEWLTTNIDNGLDIPEPPKYTGQYHLRMPPSLQETLSKLADAEGVSINQYMVTALARCAGRQEALHTISEKKATYKGKKSRTNNT